MNNHEILNYHGFYSDINKLCLIMNDARADQRKQIIDLLRAHSGKRFEIKDDKIIILSNQYSEGLLPCSNSPIVETFI